MIKKSLILLLVILIVSCSGSFNIEPAKQAVLEFHQQFNNENYENIINSASNVFSNSGKKENILKYFKGVYSKLGKHKESKLTTWNVFNGLSGKKVKLVYKAHFDNGEATEQFTFIENNGITQLFHYNIQSKIFIIGN